MRLFTSVLIQAALFVPMLSCASKNVSVDQLPAPVRATVDRETSGGQIKEIEREDELGKVTYEVEFTVDGKEYALDIAEDGKLLERRPD